MVGMRLKLTRPHRLVERLKGVVLSTLEFVAHNRHLLRAITLADERVMHTISFNRECIIEHIARVLNFIERFYRVGL